MGHIENAALMLTQCRKCLGCTRLEDLNFRGDNNCKRGVFYETQQSNVPDGTAKRINHYATQQRMDI